MQRPYNMPDEYVDGYFKSALDVWKALSSLEPFSTKGDAEGVATTLSEVHARYTEQLLALLTHTGEVAAGGAPVPAILPAKGDRRFSSADWRTNPVFSLLKQNYLLNSNYLNGLIEAMSMDEGARKRVRFFTQQFIDAMSPTNFVATNPDALKLAMDTEGESL